jgi:ATP-binding cassette subfamily C protein
MLAQVILRQPFLAVLDEATGALDADSELAVLAALRRRLSRSILVVVSHRPGVAAMADRQLVIARDRVVARGGNGAPVRAGNG